MRRTFSCTIVDVFADAPLEGNPLAVFHDGRGLTDAEMQAIARETNLSETTFVLPADDPAADLLDGVHVRIFTTEEELPFAGHPTLGTASWLRMNHPAFADATEVTLRLKGGPITVRFAPNPSLETGVHGTMRQRDAVFGDTFAPEEIAAVIGMTPADLLPGFAPQSVSTGNAFCIVALRDVATLARLAIPQQTANPWLKARGIRWFYVLAPAGNGFRARMQWLSGEDPATGSAAGPAIAWLVANGLALPDTETTILQGVEMHRPSRICARASKDGNRIGNIDIAGRTILVATAEYFLR